MKQPDPVLRINRFGTANGHVEILPSQAPRPTNGAQIVRRLPDSTALTRLVQGTLRPIK
jgi:hypothetical protein